MGPKSLQHAKSKKYLPLELRNLVAQPDLSQIKKARRFLGGLVICAKKNVCCEFKRSMPTQGPSSKFGFCPRGLIRSVCYSTTGIRSWVASLSPREGASGGVLLFSWFGEERNGNACCVWVWGARSQKIDKKTFSTKFDQNTPDLKTSSGYG